MSGPESNVSVRPGGTAAAGAESGTTAGDLIRLATSPALLLVFGALLTLGGGLTMGRYLAELPAAIEHSGVQLAGDFMAFYTGACMIRAGEGRALYDLKRQQDLQARLRAHPTTRSVGAQPSGAAQGGGWQPYVNTPLLALALAPLGGLPFVQALLVFDAAMVGALATTFLALRRCAPAVASRPAWCWAAALLILGYHPIMRTLLGGQNTVLTLALLSGALASLVAGRGRLAGVLLGLLTYKPQFAVLAMGLLAARRQWRALCWAGITTLAHYALGAACCGWNWPAAMQAAMKIYQPMERAASYHTHIALLPACDHALAKPWSLLVPALLIGLTMVLFLRAALGAPLRGIMLSLKTPLVASPDLPLAWGLMICATILVSPHLQFYDAGLLVLPAVLGLDHLLQKGVQPGAGLRLGLAAGYVFFPMYTAAEWLGFQPLVLWPVLMFTWLVLLCWRGERQQCAKTVGWSEPCPG